MMLYFIMMMVRIRWLKLRVLNTFVRVRMSV